MINVYVGYDSRQNYTPNFGRIKNPCYEVCKASILNYNQNVSIHPIVLDDLIQRGLYYRELDPLASTEFTYSRFLTPFLNDYKGIAIFCDSDFLWNCDIEELLEYYDDNYAVMCVQHDYTPRTDTKMDGYVQTTYPRKNWSSLMMFNCEHPDIKNLSVSAVNTQSPKYLHRMEWTNDVGSIPITYNYLEGDYEYLKDPKVVHFTNGGPWHETWQGDYGEMWISQYENILSKKKKFLVDIDGTICKEEGPVVDRVPYMDRIEKINKLYDEGNTIVYWTARGLSSGRGEPYYRPITEKQLQGWGCKYDELFFKPANADYFIDDRAINSEDFFE